MTLYEQILKEDPVLKRIELEALAERTKIAERTSKQLSNSIGEPKPQMRPQNDHSQFQSTQKVDQVIRQNDRDSMQLSEKSSHEKRKDRIEELLKLPEVKQAQIEHLKIKEAERQNQEKEKSKPDKATEKLNTKSDRSAEMEKAQKEFIQKLKEAKDRSNDRDRGR